MFPLNNRQLSQVDYIIRIAITGPVSVWPQYTCGKCSPACCPSLQDLFPFGRNTHAESVPLLAVRHYRTCFRLAAIHMRKVFPCCCPSLQDLFPFGRNTHAESVPLLLSVITGPVSVWPQYTCGKCSPAAVRHYRTCFRLAAIHMRKVFPCCCPSLQDLFPFGRNTHAESVPLLLSVITGPVSVWPQYTCGKCSPVAVCHYRTCFRLAAIHMRKVFPVDVRHYRTCFRLAAIHMRKVFPCCCPSLQDLFPFGRNTHAESVPLLAVRHYRTCFRLAAIHMRKVFPCCCPSLQDLFPFGRNTHAESVPLLMSVITGPVSVWPQYTCGKCSLLLGCSVHYMRRTCVHRVLAAIHMRKVFPCCCPSLQDLFPFGRNTHAESVPLLMFVITGPVSVWPQYTCGKCSPVDVRHYRTCFRLAAIHMRKVFPCLLFVITGPVSVWPQYTCGKCSPVAVRHYRTCFRLAAIHMRKVFPCCCPSLQDLFPFGRNTHAESVPLLAVRHYRTCFRLAAIHMRKVFPC